MNVEDLRASYVYIPWPVDKLTRDAVSKERIVEIQKSIIDAQKMKGQ